VPALEDFLPDARRIVSSVLRRVPANIERDDLMQAASIGIWRMLQRTPEPSRSTAARWIYGAIFDELRQLDGLGRRDRRQVKRLKTLRERREAMTYAELSAASGLPVAECFALLSADEAFQSTIHGHGDLLPEIAVEESDEDPAEFERQRLTVLSLLWTLTDQQREAVIDRMNGVPVSDTAATLGVSKSRVSQIVAAAIERLRQRIKGPPAKPKTKPPAGLDDILTRVPACLKKQTTP
jgi:RNA polymerase sigma factor FliA